MFLIGRRGESLPSSPLAAYVFGLSPSKARSLLVARQLLLHSNGVCWAVSRGASMQRCANVGPD